MAEQQRWDRLASNWDANVIVTPAFAQVRQRLLEEAAPCAADRVLDLGAGSGFITLPIAASGAEVTAVDYSEGMLELLRKGAESRGLTVRAFRSDVRELAFGHGSFSLIVSSYAFHHLSDVDKEKLLRQCFEWLEPGGRFVCADMMFSVALRSVRDRRVVWSKMVRMLRRGPAGVWRIVKNGWRFTVSRKEQPAPPGFWSRALHSAGFVDVTVEEVLGDAGLALARKTAS